MSRIGRRPIAVPPNVEVSVEGNLVRVKGPKGELCREFHRDMRIRYQDQQIVVERPSDEKLHRSLHGTTRSILQNMVQGVTEGFTKTLEIVGVGYRATKQGRKLVLAVGYSRPVEIEPPEGVEIEVPAPTRIIVRGIDKEKVGACAASIRAVREAEPYKGKGIRYEGERIRRKAGKTGAKGKK
ncbi:MAG: 50S ribosomal protein L6 [Desulfotomaculales bacterium]